MKVNIFNMKNIASYIKYEKEYNYLVENYEIMEKAFFECAHKSSIRIIKDGKNIGEYICFIGFNNVYNSIYIFMENMDNEYLFRYRNICMLIYDHLGNDGNILEVYI